MSLKCKENNSFFDLLSVVRRLRSENGCPWDQAQTHESLRRYLIEETYEVVEAIDRENPSDLREELGDLLLQIVFHAEIEREAGHFDIEDVAADECEKMIARHPHVFGDAKAEDVLAAWEANKSREKARDTLSSRLDSVPSMIPALLRAEKLLEKCASGGGETLLPSESSYDEMLAILSNPEPDKDAVGDFLMEIVHHFHNRGIECEEALSLASERLIGRVKKAEKTL